MSATRKAAADRPTKGSGTAPSGRKRSPAAVSNRVPTVQQNPESSRAYLQEMLADIHARGKELNAGIEALLARMG
jgi:hypothetical protein